MATLAPLIDAWNEAHREFDIAYGGLKDSDLWVRPHPRLLSLGELAAHVAYWQAVWVMGTGDGGSDVRVVPVQSPLVDNAFRYYTSSVGEPAMLNLGVAEVLAEVRRVHEAAVAFVADKDIDEPYPGQWQTWGNLVQYQAFHVAYHTGQAYSVRHLMGHETEDN
jgi:hypothetical protein